MSLINDALNRARAEAARKQATERGEIPAPPEAVEAAARHTVPAWLWILGALLLVAGGLLLRRAPASPTPSPAIDRPAPTAAGPGRDETAADLPAVEARSAAPDAAPADEPPATLADEADLPLADLVRSASGPSSRGADLARTPVAAAAAESPSQPALPASQPPPPSAADAPAPSPTPTPPAREPDSETEPEDAPQAIDPQTTDLPSPAAAAAATASSGDGEAATVWPQDASGDEVWYYVGTIALPGGGQIELTGIAWSASSPAAMLNGSLLRVGNEILGLRVDEIGPRTVMLSGHGRRLALQLAPGE